ncbi:SDR family NAD(P)-dependent oxidoreductase [Microbacterium sp. 179-B 1A2 NHS]|uniref:SDR family NAD(P)-dependent oxidoreductase n=1 Tax=Microbacterium sp. 179-B 1A2 NHS TaxID=3142383 RepID=UPI00399F3A88
MESSTGVVAITGGARGIGAAVARRMATSGHGVLIGYRTGEDAAAALANELRAGGAIAAAHDVDITDADSLTTFLRAAEDLGPLTGVVANAGAVRAVGDLARADPDDLRRDVDVNLLGPILTCRAAAGHLARTGGSIVLIGSAATTSGSPGVYVHYAAAKAGVAALTVGLAKELAASGVRVNCVEPGTVWTDFHLDPLRPQKVASAIPVGRAGQPEEIAGAVAYLLSEDASYTTGAVIRVAGGL